MKVLRLIHKWVAIVLGLQLILWMFSGLVMGILPHDLVQGSHNRASTEAPGPVSQGLQATRRISSGASELSVALRTFDGRAVYRVVAAAGVHLEDAATGLVIEIDEPLARKLASVDYSGPGNITGISFLEEATLAVRRHTAPIWRVDFDDPESTSLYVSASDGRVLERRNTYWRVFDFVWMLHIMDYKNRDNFNNVIVITAALILLWMGITGVILFWDSFKREDFAFVTKFKNRNLSHEIDVLDSEGSRHKMVTVRPMQTLYKSLADEGCALPSSCGGGGSCGLCRVRISPEVKITAADRRQIPGVELDAGYRLACQHRIDADATVTLPHGLLDAKVYAATIISSEFVTPYICEIRLRLVENQPMGFRAGSYLQVEVPAFTSSLDQLSVPDEVRDFWLESGMPTSFGTDETLSRTYSIANAPGEFGGDLGGEQGDELMLNVRLIMPKPDVQGVPVGIGSAWLAGLQVGDSIDVRGPFGDFAVKDGGEELVFIGGGAGMAPLRSMIVDQLKERGSSARMSYWYGARTPRDILYREEFEALGAAHDNFSFQIALSDLGPDDEWNGAAGFVHDVLREKMLSDHPDIGRCSFYVCGPPAMLQAVLQMLDELGVSQDKIAFDDFGI